MDFLRQVQLADLQHLREQHAEAEAVKAAVSLGYHLTLTCDLPFEVVVEVPEEMKAAIAENIAAALQTKIDNLTNQL